MKKIIAVLMVVIVIFTSNVYAYADEYELQAENIRSVLDAAWEEFGVFTYQYDETDYTIFILMDETKSEDGLQKYLEENLDESVLNDYKIEISKRDLKKVQQEHFLYLIDEASRFLPGNIIFYG